MKNLIILCLIACIIVGCGDKPSENTELAGEEHICGAYSEQRDISEDEMNLFRSVVSDPAFTPLSVATQVVSGLNYRFWCRHDDGSETSPSHCFVTIYQPLQGNPVLSSVEDENGNTI